MCFEPFNSLSATGKVEVNERPRNTCRIFSSPSSLASTHAANQPAKASPQRATKATKYSMKGSGCVALGGVPDLTEASLQKDTNRNTDTVSQSSCVHLLFEKGKCHSFQYLTPLLICCCCDSSMLHLEFNDSAPGPVLPTLG